MINHGMSLSVQTCTVKPVLSQTSLGPAFTFRIDRFSPSSLAKGYNPLLSTGEGGADRNPWLGARGGADRNPWLGARGGADRNPLLGADCNPWLAKMPIYRLHGMLRRSWSILVGKCLATVCRSWTFHIFDFFFWTTAYPVNRLSTFPQMFL